MKKNVEPQAESWEMRDEYDFDQLRPNKYARKYAEGTNIVVIDQDLVEYFPDNESVNAALRALVSILPKIGAKARTKKPQKGRTKTAA